MGSDYVARPPEGRGRLAAEGFVALAVDYYGGKVAASIEEAKDLRSTLDRTRVQAKVTEALRDLGAEEVAGRRKPEALKGRKLGVIGFSLGTGLAADLARTRPAEVAAVVLFYGVPGGKFDRVKASFQGHFAERDDWGATPERIDGFRERLAGAGVKHSLYTYPGTRHWFFEDDLPDAYDPEAARLAWERTVEFLKAKLR